MPTIYWAGRLDRWSRNHLELPDQGADALSAARRCGSALRNFQTRNSRQQFQTIPGTLKANLQKEIFSDFYCFLKKLNIFDFFKSFRIFNVIFVSNDIRLDIEVHFNVLSGSFTFQESDDWIESLKKSSWLGKGKVLNFISRLLFKVCLILNFCFNSPTDDWRFSANLNWSSIPLFEVLKNPICQVSKKKTGQRFWITLCEFPLFNHLFNPSKCLYIFINC